MTFTEPAFWILSLVVFVFWLAARGHYQRTIWVLLTGSLVFYGYHRWPLLFLILLYCLVDWLAALWLVRSRRPRLALTVGVGFNLMVLAYWKYTPLLLDSLARVFLALERPVTWSIPTDWAIPFGISFYAFTGIAYMVDVYRGITPAEASFVRYTLSALFFPHLVAGPILRPNEFLEKLRPGQMPYSPEAPLEALQLLGQGFFKKMALADRIAIAIDPFFAHVGDASTAGVWSLPYVYLYAFQIYFDFSGYTDIARGLGLIFGFRWPENFARPYLAASVKEFWQRWHITLSLFLRDYLYIPLGGNRQGRWRTSLNLMLTMLLGGLWHGASWSFLIWGGLHGLFLVAHKSWEQLAISRSVHLAGGSLRRLWRPASIALTFHCVCLAWCFFRLTALADSLVCVKKWFVFDGDKLFAGESADLSLWLLLAAYGIFTWLLTRLQRLWESRSGVERLWKWRPSVQGFRWGTCLMLLLLAVLLAPGGPKPPFIYFQF